MNAQTRSAPCSPGDTLIDVSHLITGAPQGYLVLFLVLLAAGLGVPIPEDIPLITAGYLVHGGDMRFSIALLVSMVGVLGGDSLVFFAGRRFARGGNGRRSLMERLVSHRNRDRVLRYFDRYGSLTVGIARFLPGLRAPAYFTAGTSGMRFYTFLLIDGLAAAVSVPVWIWLGWTFGPDVDKILGKMRGLGIILAVLLAVVVIIALVRRLLAKPPAPAESGSEGLEHESRVAQNTSNTSKKSKAEKRASAGSGARGPAPACPPD